ncbi:hypothetical protein [Candidatus Uabimicrobium sp. HlEnr_7]|uniref:hypothetical protein n=1 Tax=Candidatus Uabimicrobium helgolandensis TaxID=3095367 RepID=UPI003557B939
MKKTILIFFVISCTTYTQENKIPSLDIVNQLRHISKKLNLSLFIVSPDETVMDSQLYSVEVGSKYWKEKFFFDSDNPSQTLKRFFENTSFFYEFDEKNRFLYVSFLKEEDVNILSFPIGNFEINENFMDFVDNLSNKVNFGPKEFYFSSEMPIDPKINLSFFLKNANLKSLAKKILTSQDKIKLIILRKDKHYFYMAFFHSAVSLSLNAYIENLQRYEDGHPSLEIEIPGETFLVSDYLNYHLEYFINFHLAEFVQKLEYYDILTKNKKNKISDSNQVLIWHRLHQTQKEEAFDYMIKSYPNLRPILKDEVLTYGYLPNPKIHTRYQKAIDLMLKEDVDIKDALEMKMIHLSFFQNRYKRDIARVLKKRFGNLSKKQTKLLENFAKLEVKNWDKHSSKKMLPIYEKYDQMLFLLDQSHKVATLDDWFNLCK